MDDDIKVATDGVKEIKAAVKKLGMQRVLWELASIINAPHQFRKDSDTRYIELRNRYASQFAHNLHHETAGERNEDSLEDA